MEPGSGVARARGALGQRPRRLLRRPEEDRRDVRDDSTVCATRSPGDIAEVEADGKVKLYGRGSVCINSGGEKIFVEEVENALKSHPDVYDSVVVGRRRRALGAAGRRPRLARTRELRRRPRRALRQFTHCRKHVAGYKVPKEIYVVDEVFRGPNGKADYKLSGRRATALSEARASA